MLAFERPKCLHAHASLFECAKENPANLHASAGNRKEGVHRRHSQPVHHRHRILDGKMNTAHQKTRIRDPPSIVGNWSVLAHFPAMGKGNSAGYSTHACRITIGGLPQNRL
jgi:hypothetical protein